MNQNVFLSPAVEVLELVRGKLVDARHRLISADGDLAAQRARYAAIEKYNLEHYGSTPQEQLINLKEILEDARRKYQHWEGVFAFAQKLVEVEAKQTLPVR